MFLKNRTFNLPIAQNIVTYLPPTLAVKGTGLALGLSDGTNLGGLADNSAGTLCRKASYYGSNIGISAAGAAITNTLTIGITQDSSKSGIVSEVSGSSLICKYAIKY